MAATPSATHLQHTATHCNTLQLTATHCNRPCVWLQRPVQHTGNTLQHTATHCNTLQHRFDFVCRLCIALVACDICVVRIHIDPIWFNNSLQQLTPTTHSNNSLHIHHIAATHTANTTTHCKHTATHTATHSIYAVWLQRDDANMPTGQHDCNTT